MIINKCSFLLSVLVFCFCGCAEALTKKQFKPVAQQSLLRLSLYDLKVSSGGFNVYSVEDDVSIVKLEDSSNSIYLVDVKSGWGNGGHPTTKLCLDFVGKNVKEDCVFLDYGTGSGILSIAAAKLGAEKCFAVDICEDAIAAANNNIELNGLSDKIDVTHTRFIYLGEDSLPSFDVTVANILAGPLGRLAPILSLLTKPGGTMCLSGLRPNQLADIKRYF